MNRSRQAQWYYASGYSCEQSIFAAFAGELGLSLVKASQAAPSARSRGTGCGAFNAAAAVLTAMHRRSGKDTEEPLPPAIRDFRRMALARFGTMDCRPIMESHRRGADCLDVIGWTASCVDILIGKYYPAPTAD